MQIKLVENKDKNEITVNLYDKYNNLLKSHLITAEDVKSFDFGKILSFLKKIIVIINKLLEAYCNK